MASISSMKRMQGASFYRIEILVQVEGRVSEPRLTAASSNVSRSVFSDSPDIPDTIDGAEIEMNGQPNSYHHPISTIKSVHHSSPRAELRSDHLPQQWRPRALSCRNRAVPREARRAAVSLPYAGRLRDDTAAVPPVRASTRCRHRLHRDRPTSSSAERGACRRREGPRRRMVWIV